MLLVWFPPTNDGTEASGRNRQSNPLIIRVKAIRRSCIFRTGGLTMEASDRVGWARAACGARRRVDGVLLDRERSADQELEEYQDERTFSARCVMGHSDRAWCVGRGSSGRALRTVDASAERRDAGQRIGPRGRDAAVRFCMRGPILLRRGPDRPVRRGSCSRPRPCSTALRPKGSTCRPSGSSSTASASARRPWRRRAARRKSSSCSTTRGWLSDGSCSAIPIWPASSTSCWLSAIPIRRRTITAISWTANSAKAAACSP